MNEIPEIGKTLLGGGVASTSGVGGADIAQTMFKATSFATMISNVTKSKGKDLLDSIKEKRKNNRK